MYTYCSTSVQFTDSDSLNIIYTELILNIILYEYQHYYEKHNIHQFPVLLPARFVYVQHWINEHIKLVNNYYYIIYMM